MKKACIYTLFSCVLVAGGRLLQAQGFAGFRAGKSAGVNGVFYNPASMAGTHYKWDVNLGSLNAELGLNSLQNSDTLFTTGIKNIRKAALVTENFRANAYASADLFGPSVMLRLNSAGSVALTTRFRLMGNLYNTGGSIAGSDKDSLYNYNGSGFQKAVANAWSETGVSYAAIISKTNNYSISAGITAKYLHGYASMYAGLNNFSGTAFTGANAYLTNTYGRFFAGGSQQPDGDVRGRGMGADLGVVFEKAARPGKQHILPYKYRLGVALRDLGFMSYTANRNRHLDYDFHIPGNQRFYLNSLDDKSFEQVKNYMDSATSWFTNNQPGSNRYRVSLPANAMISMDWAITPRFFVEANAQISLVDRENQYSSFLPNIISLTPRYEGKWWGVYLPASWNGLSGFSTGLSVKLGPVFIGANSLFNKGGAISDVHMGLRLGMKHRQKPSQ